MNDLEVEVYLRRMYVPPITWIHLNLVRQRGFNHWFAKNLIHQVSGEMQFCVPQEFAMLCVCVSDSRSLCSAGIELVDVKGDMGSSLPKCWERKKNWRFELPWRLLFWANIQGYGIAGNYWYQPQGSFDPLHRFWLCAEKLHVVFSGWILRCALEAHRNSSGNGLELLTSLAFWHAHPVDLCKHTEHSSEDAEMHVPANLL